MFCHPSFAQGIDNKISPSSVQEQEFNTDDLQRIAAYDEYWGLVDGPAWESEEMQERLNTAIREAQKEFFGRGTALAQYFLYHIQASPGNTAFFFLFRAIGDVGTAKLLIQALPHPPLSQDGLGRDPGEIMIAIEAVLGNEPVRTNPDIFAALDNTIKHAREQPKGAWGVWIAEMAISLLGKCQTPEAIQLLQTLSSDQNRTIRAAAIKALGGTESDSVKQILSHTLAEDIDSEIRAQAADSLAQDSSPESILALQTSLERETNPKVVDSIVRALTGLQALPKDPAACLKAANLCWDASVAQPLFDCWRITATRKEIIKQATSGKWAVRALALRSLTQSSGAGERFITPRIQHASPPAPLYESGNIRASKNTPLNDPIPPSAALLEQAVKEQLLQSSLEILSQNISGQPDSKSISYLTAQFTRDSFWELSGRSMTTALNYADRIVPVSGRYMPIGRFGQSYDLASRDRSAYAAHRRPQQLLAEGLAALTISLLLMFRHLRKMAVALLAAIFMWALWTIFQTSVRELPPPPLFFLTVSSIAFLSAGFLSGLFSYLHVKGWLKVVTAPVSAGIFAFFICGFTRWSSLFPIGGEGWELIFDPLGSAILAIPAAFVLSLGLLRWKS